MTFKSIVNRTNIPLLLISFTYTSLWIVGVLSLILLPLAQKLNYLDMMDYLLLALFYLLSMILPMLGILLYMDNIRPVSKRWYLALPLLISVFMLTYIRDNLYMATVYEISFMSAKSSLPFLESTIGQAIAILLFSISTVLFILSMPDNKRKVMRIPFALSIIMTASMSIYYFVEQIIRDHYSAISILGFLHILCILLFGLFIGWFAVFEEKD